MGSVPSLAASVSLRSAPGSAFPALVALLGALGGGVGWAAAAAAAASASFWALAAALFLALYSLLTLSSTAWASLASERSLPDLRFLLSRASVVSSDCRHAKL